MLLPKKDVVKRYSKNPIIEGKDLPGAVRSVYNSGITKYKGQYLMVMRAETIDKKQYFWVARSKDGYNFKPDKAPLDIVVPKGREAEYDYFTNGMIYDPRVTYIEGTYYILYACHGNHGARIGMAKTKDFDKLHFVEFGSVPENRNAVLFPEKINGMYVRLERPQRLDGWGTIWVSYSPDLIHWGASKLIAEGHSRWEWKRVGPGAPPLKTPKGWLEIYHAVYMLSTAEVYSLGAILLDLKDPSKVLARTDSPILFPQETYERVGELPNVIFTSGAILEDNGEVKIYYGACDTVQCVATAKVEDLIDACYNR